MVRGICNNRKYIFDRFQVTYVAGSELALESNNAEMNHIHPAAAWSKANSMHLRMEVNVSTLFEGLRITLVMYANIRIKRTVNLRLIE